MKRMAIPIVLLVVLTLNACTRFGSAATPTVPPSPLLAKLDAGEAVWRGAGVTRYRIVVVDGVSSFAPVTRVFTITVRDGQVVEKTADCRSGPCGTPTFNAEEYTVPGLFAQARANASDPKLATNLTLDPTYGFPTYLATSVPNATESSGSLRVEQFQPLT